MQYMHTLPPLSVSKFKHNHMCKLIHETSIINHDLMSSPNFEFSVFEAEEESVKEIPDEISWLLEQEEETIQPYKEPVEVIKLGSEEDRKEVKIGALLVPPVEEIMIKLIREYMDVFALSYQDMTGLDTYIVERGLPLKLECPLVK